MKMHRNVTNPTPARRRWVLAIAIGALTPIAVQMPTANADTEFGDNTPYYEDDAWYDVSEWFDGNDYNPTYEAIGRWDDETFDVSDNLTSSDNDNFLNWGESSYGYYDGNESSDDNWFYDYYDYGYYDYDDLDNDGIWDYTASYYDYDYDGIFDSVTEFIDTDGDGIYEDLGPADNFDPMPRLGQDIRVEGSMFKAGEKTVLVARNATRDG